MAVARASALAICIAGGANAEQPSLLPTPVPPTESLRAFVRTAEPVVALTHARIIDGTGGPVQADKTIVIDHGRIAAILPVGSPAPASATVIDMTGKTVLPGIVGMHDHLYYVSRPTQGPDNAPAMGPLLPQMSFSAPRLYLAGGVTTIRTTGSVEPYTDLNLKQAIDAGELAGPHIDVTGPYLQGPGGPFIQMYVLRDAQDARETVAFWADRGVTSFKAYTNITRDELRAGIEEAHRRGLKLTGHLCSVTYPEAADLGIDDLEHGFTVNTQLDHDKQPDRCTESRGGETLEKMDPEGPEAAALIALLVRRHVAVTSTLPVREPIRASAPPGAAMLETMTPQARASLDFMLHRKRRFPDEKYEALFRNELAMERKFSEAGGLLIAGPDPTGLGNVVPGFSDQREIELLVEAGLSPAAAVRVATLNGAIYLGAESRIGSVEAGKNADLMVVDGDPSASVADIERVELVFKDGVGWDAAALRQSVAGDYGLY